jgi:hypothetical protein
MNVIFDKPAVKLILPNAIGHERIAMASPASLIDKKARA